MAKSKVKALRKWGNEQLTVITLLNNGGINYKTDLNMQGIKSGQQRKGVSNFSLGDL